MSTMPSLVPVAAMATMSATGAAEAEKRKVLSPEMIGAGLAFVHSKLNCTSVGGIGTLGVYVESAEAREASIDDPKFAGPIPRQFMDVDVAGDMNPARQIASVVL